MNVLRRLLERWPVVAAALLAAGIVHIITIFLLPQVYRTDAFRRLAPTLPVNAFVIFPTARPRAQVLPFQLPDSRYAICRFDLGSGPVIVRASLTEPGWTLSAYTASGETFYALPASEQRRLNLTLLIMPSAERFMGAMTTARDLDHDTSQVTAPSRTGLIVIQAPLKGRSFATEIESTLASAACKPLEL
jgi:uncharacterized membrane protein